MRSALRCLIVILLATGCVAVAGAQETDEAKRDLARQELQQKRLAARQADPAWQRQEAMRKGFRDARKAGQWQLADALVPQLLAEDWDRDDVIAYLIHDRGRCGEALVLLREARKLFRPKYINSSYSQLRSALVCEAARLEPIDLPASAALLSDVMTQ
jgi:Ni/Co efflux regulator RcnB